MITVQFSMSNVPLTDAEKPIFNAMGQWVIVNERNSKFFVDAVCDPAIIKRALTALSSRNPVIIGVWDHEGNLDPAYPLNEREWLDVAPDVLTYNPRTDTTSTSRPTKFADVHRWAGWKEKK